MDMDTTRKFNGSAYPLMGTHGFEIHEGDPPPGNPRKCATLVVFEKDREQVFPASEVFAIVSEVMRSDAVKVALSDRVNEILATHKIHAPQL